MTIRTRPHTPPRGPRWPALIQTWRYLARHRGAPAAWRRRYGDTFVLRVYPGRRLLAVTTPAAVGTMFRARPADLTAAGGNKVLEPVVGRESLLLLDGERHRRARTVQMPAFHGAALRGYPDMIAALADDAFDDWPRGTPTRVADLTSALTLEVILRVVFGVTDGARLAALRGEVRRLLDMSPIDIAVQLVPALRRTPLAARTQRRSAHVRRLLADEIRERRNTSDGASGPDALSHLLTAETDMTETELLDHLVTLVVAGHETTAKALAWAMHDLAHHRDVQARARRAVDTGDTDYLTAVFRETLRRNNVVGQVSRLARCPVDVDGTGVDRGDLVAAQLDLLHLDPALHPEPTAFRPERFLGDGPARGTFLPFGAGVHRCLGAEFAVIEGVTILQRVLSRFDIEAVGAAEPGRIRNITNGPARGARLVLRERTDRDRS